VPKTRIVFKHDVQVYSVGREAINPGIEFQVRRRTEIAMSDATFEQVKQMITQLEPDEVERLRAWLNTPMSNHAEPDTQSMTWGQQLARLIENFPVEEGDQMGTDDPEAWVRERRRTKTHRRNPGWGES
jgi:hypothetical protein